MRFRLNEGGGLCLYEVGVYDNGEVSGLEDKQIRASMSALYFMSQQFNS